METEKINILTITQMVYSVFLFIFSIYIITTPIAQASQLDTVSSDWHEIAVYTYELPVKGVIILFILGLPVYLFVTSLIGFIKQDFVPASIGWSGTVFFHGLTVVIAAISINFLLETDTLVVNGLDTSFYLLIVVSVLDVLVIGALGIIFKYFVPSNN